MYGCVLNDRDERDICAEVAAEFENTNVGRNNHLNAYLRLSKWLSYSIFDILYLEGPKAMEIISRYIFKLIYFLLDIVYFYMSCFVGTQVGVS